MDLISKLDALLVVNRILNRIRVTYALGASTLLYFKGINKSFDSIDIMTSADVMETVLTELERLGYECITETHCKGVVQYIKFKLDGVTVNIFAGIKIYNDGITKIISFNNLYIHEYVDLMGVYIPLMSCETWYTWYKLFDEKEIVSAMRANNHLW